MTDILILGIDGGATKINGWIVDYNSEAKEFALGSTNIQKKYSEFEDYIPGYKPVDIKVQLEEMNSGVNLTSDEIKHGNAYIKAAAEVIKLLSQNANGKKIIIGFGMPGLKTTDKRGIIALANGPRMPLFAEKIENILKKNNVNLHKPIQQLGSDADYCGIGEEYDIEGLFKNVNNAYYLGGGTGVADALKLNGKIIALDQTKDWLAKTWEMKSESGLSLERYASAGGIQFIYSQFSGIPVEELNNNDIYPPQILQLAIEGDKHALNTINDVSENIAKLIFERITTLYFGWSNIFSFVNENKPNLNSKHLYLKQFFDRIIIGQRLGDLLEESKSSNLLWTQIIDKLSELTIDINDEIFKTQYLSQGIFKKNIIKISKLREAPVIGAGVDAYLVFNK